MDKSQISDFCGKENCDCCIGAKPPLTENKKHIITQKYPDVVFWEYKHGYNRIITKERDQCFFLVEGRCIIHNLKPETCIAGPITFDLDEDYLHLYIKQEHRCNLIDYFLINQEQLHKHIRNALNSIRKLLWDLKSEELKAILNIEDIGETVYLGKISNPLKIDDMCNWDDELTLFLENIDFND